MTPRIGTVAPLWQPQNPAWLDFLREHRAVWTHERSSYLAPSPMADRVRLWADGKLFGTVVVDTERIAHETLDVAAVLRALYEAQEQLAERYLIASGIVHPKDAPSHP